MGMNMEVGENKEGPRNGMGFQHAQIMEGRGWVGMKHSSLR